MPQPSGFALLDDRAVLRVGGPEARDFLQGLISNDITRVDSETTLYAALLTPQGKFLFDFFILAQGDGFLFDTRADWLGELTKKLIMYKLRADVDIKDVSDSYQIGAVFGEAASALTQNKPTARGATWRDDDVIFYGDPRHEAMGVRLLLPKGTADQVAASLDLTSVSRKSYDHHRLGLGVPEGGLDILSDKAFLLESNFDEMQGVDHQKGCYIGQETTSRTKRRGSVRRRLLPVTVDAPLPEPGASIRAGDVEIGTLMTGQDGRAMASIRLDRWEKSKADGHTPTVDGHSLTITLPDWIKV